MIQVINRALSILEFLATDPGRDFSLSEIADQFQLNRATCVNILKTLSLREYVEHIAPKSGYRIGRMAYMLTNNRAYNNYLIQIASPAMETLGKYTDESVILSAVQNDKRILLREIVSNHEIQVRTQDDLNVYRAATGRLIISHYSEEKLRDMVARIGLPSSWAWPQITSMEDLVSALEEVRKQELIETINESGVIGLATPIIYRSQVIASLGIYLPSSRYGKSVAIKIKAALLEATAEINAKLKSGFMVHGA